MCIIGCCFFFLFPYMSLIIAYEDDPADFIHFNPLHCMAKPGEEATAVHAHNARLQAAL